ncbi:MAG: hypothetical protein ACI4I6_08800 [Hominimerdicola sp.]
MSVLQPTPMYLRRRKKSEVIPPEPTDGAEGYGVVVYDAPVQYRYPASYATASFTPSNELKYQLGYQYESSQGKGGFKYKYIEKFTAPIQYDMEGYIEWGCNQIDANNSWFKNPLEIILPDIYFESNLERLNRFAAILNEYIYQYYVTTGINPHIGCGSPYIRNATTGDLIYYPDGLMGYANYYGGDVGSLRLCATDVPIHIVPNYIQDQLWALNYVTGKCGVPSFKVDFKATHIVDTSLEVTFTER